MNNTPEERKEGRIPEHERSKYLFWETSPANRAFTISELKRLDRIIFNDYLSGRNQAKKRDLLRIMKKLRLGTYYTLKHVEKQWKEMRKEKK